MTISTVAVIGLGNMGGPMAINLAKAGLETRGFDVSDQARMAVAEVGVSTFDSATVLSFNSMLSASFTPHTNV